MKNVPLVSGIPLTRDDLLLSVRDGGSSTALNPGMQELASKGNAMTFTLNTRGLLGYFQPCKSQCSQCWSCNACRHGREDKVLLVWSCLPMERKSSRASGFDARPLLTEHSTTEKPKWPDQLIRPFCSAKHLPIEREMVLGSGGSIGNARLLGVVQNNDLFDGYTRREIVPE